MKPNSICCAAGLLAALGLAAAAPAAPPDKPAPVPAPSFAATPGRGEPPTKFSVADSDAPPNLAPSSAELEQARDQVRSAKRQLRQAQETLAQVEAKLGIETPRAFVYDFANSPKRAVLGLLVRPRERGVQVDAVTPGGAADAAGLRAGDRLLAINDTRLDALPGEQAQRALHDVTRELEVGQKVRLRYERDGKAAEVSVTADRPKLLRLFSQGMFAGEPGPQPAPDGPPFAGPPPPPELPLLQPPDLGAPVLGMHMPLAKLDPDLAAYFKTDKGVLVIHVPEGEALGLKSGDVIQSINGHEVSAPVEAMGRFVESGFGNPVSVQVLRHGQAVTLNGTLPKMDEVRRLRGKREMIGIE